MKKTQRLLALVMAMMLVLALLAGCGNGGDTTSVEPSGSADASATPSNTGAQDTGSPDMGNETAGLAGSELLPIVNELTDITICSYDRPFLWDVMDNYDQNFVQEELSARTNIHCDFYWYSGLEQLQVNLAAGDYYDLYWNLNSFYNGGWSRAYEDGILIDVSDLVKEYMPNYYSLLTSDQLALNCVTDSEGRMLHIAQLTTEVSDIAGGLMIREDYLKDLGIDASSIKTYDQLYNALMAIKTEIGTKSPLYMFNNGTLGNNVLSAGYGVNGYVTAIDNLQAWMKKDGEVKYGPMEDGFIEYLTVLRGWYADGLYDSDFMSHDDSRFLDNDGIWRGDYACLNYNWEIVDELTKNGRDYDDDFQYVALPDPVQNEGDTINLTNNYTWTRWSTFDIVISTACEIPEIACQWMDYSYTEDGILLGNFGVEGISFEYVDGKPKFIESFLTDNYLVGDAGVQMVKNACLGTNSAYARIVTAYDDFSSDYAVNARSIWASNMQLDDFKASYDMITAIAVDTSVSGQYTNIMTEVNTYLNEWIPQYIMGLKDASEWPAVQAELERMGINTARDWMQEAYDDFMGRA